MPAEFGTHCPYCAFQCGMTLGFERGEVVVRPRDFPTNKGGLCRKGWTAASLLTTPDRLTSPLVRDRKDGPLRPASWNEALDRIVGSFRATQQRHGRDAVGLFGGPDRERGETVHPVGHSGVRSNVAGGAGA